VITTTSYQWSLVPARDNHGPDRYVTAPKPATSSSPSRVGRSSILYLGLPTSVPQAGNLQLQRLDRPVERGAANPTVNLIFLQAGQRYYIEAVYRDGPAARRERIRKLERAALPAGNASVRAVTQPFLILRQSLHLCHPTCTGGISYRIWDARPTTCHATRTGPPPTPPPFLHEQRSPRRYRYNHRMGGLDPMIDNYEAR
jgi:hypothetical protein